MFIICLLCVCVCITNHDALWAATASHHADAIAIVVVSFLFRVRLRLFRFPPFLIIHRRPLCEAENIGIAYKATHNEHTTRMKKKMKREQ